MMLNMQFRTSQYQVLILALLFVAVVQTRRVIRAAPRIKTTSQYMVVLTPDTIILVMRDLKLLLK